MTWAGKRTKTEGLTLIEMLVVVAVIGILSAIVLVGYNAVQGRTADAAVESDLASGMKILKEYYSENNKFPTAAQVPTLGTKLGFATSNYDISNNAVIYCYSTDLQQASLIGKSKTGTSYYVTNNYTQPRVHSASFPVSGATSCPDSGLPVGSAWLWVHGLPTGWATWVQ